MSLITEITAATDRYNLHSHTQFCDGHAPMETMARAASDCGMLHYGFSPHSPICVESGANMSHENVNTYLDEVNRLKSLPVELPQLYAAMEIDFISVDFGPHIDMFQRMPLDYRIGSVHFVPNQDGISVDCDGSADRFLRYLKDAFGGDLRYVVEKYFEQVLTMLERGGFDMLGHFDKIAQNASVADPGIENQPWYEALIDDVVSHAKTAGVVVEINTKYINDKGRFFPHDRWWQKLKDAEMPIAVNSDAHWPEKVDEGRRQAYEKLRQTGLHHKAADVNGQSH